MERGTPYRSRFRRNTSWVRNRYTGSRPFYFFGCNFGLRESECVLFYFFAVDLMIFFPLYCDFGLRDRMIEREQRGERGRN